MAHGPVSGATISIALGSSSVIEYDNALYKQRHKVENMLGKTV